MFRGFFYAQNFYKGIKAFITGTDGIVAVVDVVVVLCRGGWQVVVVWCLSDTLTNYERTDKMATSTRINAFLTDAVNKHPRGFTMDVNTGEVITHGIAVAGYHRDVNPEAGADWLQWSNNGAGFVVPFEVLQEQIELWLPTIQDAGYIGGWVKDNVLTLDIVQVYDCIIHSQGIQEATAFLEGSRLEQEAIGWLCPDFNGGYKEVMVNF